MKKIIYIFILFLILLLALVGRFYFFVKKMQEVVEKENSKLILKSSAFKHGDFIPQRFTGDGDDINPLLEIKNVPPETKSLALIFDDPDATGGETWIHWVLWNISPDTQYIMEDGVPNGAIVGVNSWGKNSYGGPYPPVGSKPHRYFFKLFALDTTLDIPSSSKASDLERAMNGHILDKAELMGFYKR
jgi:hypothetical protein